MIFESPPPDFDSAFEAASCLLHEGDSYLFLHRAPGTFLAAHWGCPTGKIEPGECPRAAMRREVMEETGFQLPDGQLIFLEKLYVRFPEFDFTYHLFMARLEHRPELRLNTREHSNYGWLTLENARRHNLVPDMKEVLDRFEARVSNKG